MTVAEVRLWRKTVGAVSWNAAANVASFEYDPGFADSSIEVAPLTMPLARRIYSFPALPRDTFHGLPGLVADSLPDDFGNALIDAWLAMQGRSAESFNPVERLCYVGARGMGAIEYLPVIGPSATWSQIVEVGELVALAEKILSDRHNFCMSLSSGRENRVMEEILRVGTSAGGARAKAVIAWNPETNEVRSGQADAEDGFSYWLLKFDGVSGGFNDVHFSASTGYGLIEFGYYKMAQAAGIDMMESRLLKENGRSHFMTRRFDRTGSGRKLHMQTLGAISHYDYRMPGVYSYEQCLATIRDLEKSMDSVEEQFRRMSFNVIARNQDDHVKNIAFLMDRGGNWRLAPAYDLTYSFNSEGAWTNAHQMTLNGKRDNFQLDDFKACAKHASMKRGRAEQIIDQVQSAVAQWESFADEAGVDEHLIRQIRQTHRTGIL